MMLGARNLWHGDTIKGTIDISGCFMRTDCFCGRNIINIDIIYGT